MNVVKPPFAWVTKHINWINELVIVALAVGLRAWQLFELPPGLTGDEAKTGLAALNLIHHGVWPLFEPSAGFAPLWVVMQSLPVMLFGHDTIWVLRLWPALLGVVAVWATWRWARDWFGVKVGWMTAFIFTVLPWSVAISRDATGAVLRTFYAPNSAQ